MSKWISVEDKLPENEEPVLVCAEIRPVGKQPIRLVVRAFHTDGRTRTEDSAYTWDFCDFDVEYDENRDDYIVPEGWWESVHYTEEFAAVSDFVTHWMPLPDLPEAVLSDKGEGD